MLLTLIVENDGKADYGRLLLKSVGIQFLDTIVADKSLKTGSINSFSFGFKSSSVSSG